MNKDKWTEELQALLKKMPKTLWIFVASGILCVMRKGDDGKPVIGPLGGYDQDYVLATLNVPGGIDGGDW